MCDKETHQATGMSNSSDDGEVKPMDMDNDSPTDVIAANDIEPVDIPADLEAQIAEPPKKQLGWNNF